MPRLPWARIRAPPLTCSPTVSWTKSTRSSPTCGFSLMLPRLAITPLPLYSGQASVRSSSTSRNPGGPARRVLSHSPARSEGRQEEHPLAADEVDASRVEVVEELVAVEAVGTVGGAELALQGALAGRARGLGGHCAGSHQDPDIERQIPASPVAAGAARSSGVRRAPSDGVTSRNAGAVHPRSANAPVTAAATASTRADGHQGDGRAAEAAAGHPGAERAGGAARPSTATSSSWQVTS